MSEQEQQELMNHPEMQKLLARQERQRRILLEYLKDPKPRFISERSTAGWCVIDRMTENIVEGFFDTEQQSKSAAAASEQEWSE